MRTNPSPILPERMRVAHLAQGMPDLQHGRVCGQHVERLAWGVAASADFMASARSGMTGPTGSSAYLSRTAMSSALMPLTVKGAASVLPSSLASASISKSTSQSHETSRPSASLSFMAIRTLRASAPVTKVRRISLNPTGFFMSSRKASLSPAFTRSTLPKAPRTP